MIIKNGTVVDPTQGMEEIGTVYIRGNRIERFVPGEYQPEAADAEEEVIDASGRYVMPGLIDLHVHFRDPDNDTPGHLPRRKPQ